MCGRYAMALPPWRVRQLLQDGNMPTNNPPNDEDDDDGGAARQSYNFAPGYYGLVYRQDVPDHGAAGGSSQQTRGTQESPSEATGAETSAANLNQSTETIQGDASDSPKTTRNSPPQSSPHYKLQAMQWGLTPFWTKRRPDYATILKTINCRDDSLARSGGMWHTMKQKKRCIVVAQGFFEWLKKNEGKDKLPHYIKRKDGQLMCFAGLFDYVKYEESDHKHYSYTIITTDANKQITFLHDRMPVIFENGSNEMFTWLDSTNRSSWSGELQSLLQPYTGELEIYPVTKDMNKAGSSSPNFIVPIDDSKQSISHFFGKKSQSVSSSEPKEMHQSEHPVTETQQIKHEHVEPEDDFTEYEPESKPASNNVSEDVNEESNAPIPATPVAKRSIDADNRPNSASESAQPSAKAQKQSSKQSSPTKNTTPISSKRSKSATSNSSVSKESPIKSNKKITSFFKK